MTEKDMKTVDDANAFVMGIGPCPPSFKKQNEEPSVMERRGWD